MQLRAAPGDGDDARAWRQAYRCDCDGASHRAVGVEGPRADVIARQVQRTADAIETETGHRHEGCPWRSFYEPIVGEALSLRRLAATGDDVSLAAVLPMAPPAVIVEAAQVYGESYARAVGARAERERKQREAAQRSASAMSAHKGKRGGPRG